MTLPTTNAPQMAKIQRLNQMMSAGGMVIVLLVAIVLITSLIEPRFLNRMNLVNVLRNCAFLAIPAMGQMLVMIAGGFDLSVGAVMAMSSVITATMMSLVPGGEGLASVTPVLVALAAGTAVGLGNGVMVVVFRISPFMVTLATMSILTGMTLFYTQGIPIYGVHEGFIELVGRGRFLSIPFVFWLTLGLTAAFMVVQRKMRFGRHLYAVGGDEKASRLSGVGTSRILLAAYSLSGLLAALTGVLITARIGSGQSTIGTTLGLETIAAAVIGGVSLRGGSGRVQHVVLAALLITILANAMNLVRIDSKLQTLVLGLILIIALGVERLMSQRISDD